MKFRDIKLFPHSNYSIDVEWSYLDKTLEILSEIGGMDTSPDYQRGYVWNEKQRVEYIEYILKGGVSGRDIFWNAKNWQGEGEMGILELVDGKQRLNAVQMFLEDKLPIFGGNLFSDFEDRPNRQNARFKFHINNLPSKVEVVDWYLGMNTSGSIHTEKDLEAAYEYRKSLK